MIRHLKVARDTAVKARTQAMLTLKAIIVGAPAALRERLEAITGKMALTPTSGGLAPGAADHDHRLGQGQPARQRSALARPRCRDQVARRPPRSADGAVRAGDGRGARRRVRDRGREALVHKSGPVASAEPGTGV